MRNGLPRPARARPGGPLRGRGAAGAGAGAGAPGALARRQAARLAALAGGVRRVVEVGAYQGDFLAAAREAGWAAVGVEVNELAAARLRARGFSVLSGALEALETEPGGDAVAIWNCFDQLPDPRATARAAHRILRPGGLLAVRVPNGAFYAALHRPPRALRPPARALLAHSNLLGFPYRFGFTPSSLARLLGECGFRVSRGVGDALVPLADEWTRGWAAREERLLHALLRRLPTRLSPWFELYLRAA